MGRRPRREASVSTTPSCAGEPLRHREASISKTPSCAGNMIDEASAMLLYEAPYGIAIFSFDEAYLNNSVKDFWADIPQFSLEDFMDRDKVSTPFDPANWGIDDHLAEVLARHCGSERKLVVRSAQHKTIIEKKLGITCLCVDVPDDLIKCSPKNPMHALLPGESSEMSTSDYPFKDLIIAFLHQHDFDVKPEMVSKCIVDSSLLLLDAELREKEHLTFFHILLRDFIVKSGIETKNWRLFHFATVLKMICCPRSSFRIYPPHTIFSRDEVRKILANASQYKSSFPKINALSFYEDVVSLYSKKSLLMDKLDFLVEDAKGDIKIDEAPMLLLDAPFGFTIFSFDDGTYLNNSVKDFWANIPQLSLEELIKHETMYNLVGISENTIDDHLAESLTRHCGSKKKLVVGSDMHKTIIEKELGITCLYVDFHLPDCELIKSSLKVPMHTLLPEQLLMSTRDYHFKDLITFLRQHDFDVEPEMVNDSIDKLTHRLRDVESCEMECLKFFRLLLGDFIVKSGIDTENWKLFHFATVPKLMCCPGSSYEIYPPVEIFSSDEHWMIEDNAFRYTTRFSKIDPLYVYEYALSLYLSKCSLLQDLDVLVKKAKDRVQEAANMDGVERHKHAVDNTGIQSMDDYGRKLTANMDGVERNKKARDTCVRSMDDYGKKLTANMEGVERNKPAYPSGEITKSGTVMDHLEWERAANEASANGAVSSVSNPAYPSGEITKSGTVMDHLEWERAANEASANGAVSSVSNPAYPSGEITKSGTVMDHLEWERAANEASANGAVSSVSNPDLSSGGGMLPPSGKVGRTSKIMKQVEQMIKKKEFWPHSNKRGIDEEALIDSLQQSGSTACVVLLRKNRLITANAGLSRCVISRKNETFAITTDHSRGVHAENKRIHKAKASVLPGQMLSDKDTDMEEAKDEFEFTRAIGYLKFKQNKALPLDKQILIANPAVKIVELKGDIEYVLLASADFWRQVSAELAIEKIKCWTNRGLSLSEVSVKLQSTYTFSKRNGAQKNLMLIIIKLETQQSQEPPEGSSSNKGKRVPFKQGTVLDIIEDPKGLERLNKEYIFAQDKLPEEVFELLRVKSLRGIEEGDEHGSRYNLPSRATRFYEYNTEIKQVCLKQGPFYLTREAQKGRGITKNMKICMNLLESGDTNSVKGVAYRAESVCSHQQSESALRDICLLAGSTRSSLNVYGTPKGSISGAVVLVADGIVIDCAGGGVGGMKIPVEVEKGSGITQVRCKDGFDIKYILLVEKESIFLTLMDLGFQCKNNCILVTGSGMPDVATRKVMRKLVEWLHVPAFCLVDGNPYGIRIFTVYKFGSRSLACNATGLTVPSLELIGLFPDDFELLNKSSLQELSKNDRRVLTSLLQMTYVTDHKDLKHHLQCMKTKGFKAQIDVLQDDLGSDRFVEYIRKQIELAKCKVSQEYDGKREAGTVGGGATPMDY